MSVARDSLTSRMRPRRSAASGCRIWERMEVRWEAGGWVSGGEEGRRGLGTFALSVGVVRLRYGE